MSEGFDVEKISAGNFNGQHEYEKCKKDYKRIKEAIEKQEQQEIEDLIKYENVNYNVVQAIIDYAPHLGASFFAELFETRSLSTSFLNTVNNWNSDNNKVLFANELLKNPRIKNNKDLFDKLTTIAATVENKKAKEKLSFDVKKLSFYKFKDELFSSLKNKPEALKELQISLQRNENGKIYEIFSELGDNKKAKLISNIEPLLKETGLDFENVPEEELTPIEMYNLEIMNVACVIASTIQKNEFKYSLPSIIREDKRYIVRDLLNEKISKANKINLDGLERINEAIGKELDVNRLVLEFNKWHGDKSKIEFIDYLPDLEDEYYKKIALTVASTIEKKKNKDKINEELKEDYRYKIIDALGISSDSGKIGKNEYARIMRDVIDERIRLSTTKDLKDWYDDNGKINAIKRLLSINNEHELSEKQSKIVGKLAVGLVQSIKDNEIKLKAPEYKENETYSKYFKFIGRFEKLEEELKKPVLEEDESKYDLGIDKRLRFGIEIESEGDSSLFLLNEEKIRNEGNKVSPKVWKIETDTTLKDGAEVKSPILSNIPRDVRNIELVNDALKEMRQDVNERCGAHVHFGADYLKSGYSFINLMEIYTNCEEIFYLISNKEGELPRSTTKEIVDFINPRLFDAIEKEKINQNDYDGKVRFVKKVKDAQITRNVGLNVYNVNKKEKDTVEFRLSNGTLDGKEWCNNIRLYGKLMEISERLGEAERKYYIDDIEPTEEELRLLKLEDDLKNPKLSRDEKKDILFDLLFGDDKVREIYEKRYEVNSKLSEQTPVENNPIKQTKFNVIDFKKVFNIKNLIIKNKNIDLIQTEQEMMDNLKEMEQAKVLKQDRSNNKIKNNRDLEEK